MVKAKAQVDQSLPSMTTKAHEDLQVKSQK